MSRVSMAHPSSEVNIEETGDAAEVTQPRNNEYPLMILAGLAIMYTLYFARVIFLPLCFALLLNFALKPLVLKLKDLRIPEALGSLGVITVLSGVFIVTVMALAEPSSEWMGQAPKHFATAEAKLRSLRAPFEDIQHLGEQAEGLTALPHGQTTRKVKLEQPSLVEALFNTTGTFTVGLLLTFVLLFFLLAAGDRTLNKLVSLMPSLTDKRRMVNLGRDIQQSISSYLFSITFINIGLAFVVGTTLYFLGLPNASLWGVMAGVLNFIPVLGFLVGSMVIFLVSLVTFDSISYSFLISAIYLCLTLFEANFVTPVILGRSIQLEPIAIVLATTLFGWMWGVGGVVLAVPLLAVSKICSEHLAEDSRYARLVSLE